MLKVNIEYRKGILFVRLKGFLTVYTYDSLNNYLSNIIRQLGIKYIVFNLSKLDVMDNYGRLAITSIINEVKNNHGRGLICKSKLWFDEKFKIIDDELTAFKMVKI